ncbi:hypothetical protein GQ53DRAFT_751478 [Thozetella sp. PMI_491]|nr:hypothetical protein GQ53DRAFT_751478 [Thozetella sp. PMI_491]
MWSAIGLATARRVRVGGPVPAAKLLARLTSRVPQPQAAAPVGRPVSVYVIPRRGYADASDAAAEKKPKKKSAGTKKAATGTKKKAAAKPKKPAARAKKVKVSLTPEQKDRAEKAKNREVALLKSQPAKLPVYARGVWVSEVFKTTKPEEKLWTRAEVTKTLTKAVQEYKRLPESEHTRLNAIATENKAANAAAQKAWLESFTPLQVFEANQARRRLGLSFLKDDRLPLQPRNAYSLFVKSRFQSDEYASSPGKPSSVAAITQMAEEWNKMNEEERKPFYDQAEADRERYAKECDEVFGLKPKLARRSKSKTE